MTKGGQINTTAPQQEKVHDVIMLKGNDDDGRVVTTSTTPHQEKKLYEYDVMLKGNDDAPAIQANKTLLAAQSPVLERMFYGSFQERNAKVISFDYPSIVLQVLVTFSESSGKELDIDHLLDDVVTAEDDDDEEEEECVLTDEEAISLIRLRDAAIYFDMTEVFKAVNQQLADFLSQERALPAICPILNDLYDRDECSDEHSMAAMLKFIVSKEASSCFLSTNQSNRGILGCQPALFCKLISDQHSQPLLVVKCIKLWCHAYQDLVESSASLKDRLQIIANGLMLHKIPMEELDKIEPCTFFSRDRLYLARVRPRGETTDVANNSSNMSLWKLFGSEGVMHPTSTKQLVMSFDNVQISNNTRITARQSTFYKGTAQVSGWLGANLHYNGVWHKAGDCGDCKLMYFKDGLLGGRPSEFFLTVQGQDCCTLSVVPKSRKGVDSVSSIVAACGPDHGQNFNNNRPKKLFVPPKMLFVPSTKRVKVKEDPGGEGYHYGVIPYLWELESPCEPEPFVIRVAIKPGLLVLKADIREPSLCPEKGSKKGAQMRRYVKAKLALPGMK